jgi:hypothetical protein
LLQQVSAGNTIPFHIEELFCAIARLEFAPLKIGNQFFPNRLGFPHNHGIRVLLGLVRAHRNVNASQHHLFAATPEKIGQLIRGGGHVRHGRNPHQIGVGIEIDRLDAFIGDARFDVWRSNGRENRQVKPRKRGARLYLHVFGEAARHFEHLWRTKDVVRIVRGDQQKFQRLHLVSDASE